MFLEYPEQFLAIPSFHLERRRHALPEPLDQRLAVLDNCVKVVELHLRAGVADGLLVVSFELRIFLLEQGHGQLVLLLQDVVQLVELVLLLAGV